MGCYANESFRSEIRNSARYICLCDVELHARKTPETFVFNVQPVFRDRNRTPRTTRGVPLGQSREIKYTIIQSRRNSDFRRNNVIFFRNIVTFYKYKQNAKNCEFVLCVDGGAGCGLVTPNGVRDLGQHWFR